jgi:hypothetical protein
MSVQNSVRSYLGIAKEVTKGTAVTPTDFLPVMGSSLKPVDVIDPLYDEGLRGSLVKNYNYLPGRTRSTYDFSGSAFADTIGYAIAVTGSVSADDVAKATQDAVQKFQEEQDAKKGKPVEEDNQGF